MTAIFLRSTALLLALFLSSANCQANWWDFLTPELTTPPPAAPVGAPDALTDFYDTNDEGVCCECVPFYLCSDNGTIIDSGADIIGPRIGANGNREINVETCSDVTQFCCTVPTAAPTCPTSNIGSKDLGNGASSSTCECVHWEICLEEYRVSDGSEPSTFIEGVGLPKHSKCNHSLEVCCAFDLDTSTTVTTPVPTSGASPDGCVCVNPWLCDANGYVITDGTDIIDLKINIDEPCAAPFTCCKVPPQTPSPGPVTKPVKTGGTKTTIIEDQKCHGVRNSEGIAVRISGFKEGESQFGEFPWVGMILSTYFVAGQPMNSFLGGAILIHPRVLLTAAHKVASESTSTLHVRVGEWDIQTDFEPGQHQIRAVDRIITHPAFNSKTLYHDVALIILTEPVVLQSHIRSICLAQSLDDVDTSRCVTNGWGEDSFESNNYQTVMKSVEVPIVPHRRCQALFRQTRLGRWFKLHPSFLCAGGVAGRDACRSDGGGPLACPSKANPSEYLLVGITAWGIGCGQDDVPGAYASTIEDRRWIMDQMSQVFPDSHSLLKRDVRDESTLSILGGSRTFRNNPTSTEATVTTAETTTVETTTSTEPSTTRPRRGLEERIRRRIERERRRRAERRRVNHWSG